MHTCYFTQSYCGDVAKNFRIRWSNSILTVSGTEADKELSGLSS